MKVLVTGNHGFIGYILTNRLLKEGHDVIGYDINYFPEDKCFGRKDAYEARHKVSKQITKDIRDATKDDFRGVDVVMHLAALPNDPACDLNPEIAYDINFLSTVQLATLAKRANVKRFIYASSCSVFGVKGEKILNEEDMPAPITPYGFSKLNSEICLKLMSSNKFATTCMRNATCYGVSPRMRFDMVLNNLMGYAFTEGKVKILSDGTAWRPIVHIEDVAKAYILAMEAPMVDVSSQVFSICSENFKVSEIAEIVKKTVPKSEIEYPNMNNKDWRSYNVNFDKAKKILSYEPDWNAKKGANELYGAYKAVKLTRESFQENLYWAGKQFKYLIDAKKVDHDLKMR